MASKALALIGAVGALAGIAVAASGGSSKKKSTGNGLPPIPDWVTPGNIPPGVSPITIDGVPQPTIVDLINTGFTNVQNQTPVNTGRYATVQAGEGPDAFVKRVSGAAFGWRPGGGANWKMLRLTNPSLEYNNTQDNYTTRSWYAGLVVKMPDPLPGGTPMVNGTSPGGSLFGTYT